MTNSPYNMHGRAPDLKRAPSYASLRDHSPAYSSRRPASQRDEDREHAEASVASDSQRRFQRDNRSRKDWSRSPPSGYKAGFGTHGYRDSRQAYFDHPHHHNHELDKQQGEFHRRSAGTSSPSRDEGDYRPYYPRDRNQDDTRRENLRDRAYDDRHENQYEDRYERAPNHISDRDHESRIGRSRDSAPSARRSRHYHDRDWDYDRRDSRRYRDSSAHVNDHEDRRLDYDDVDRPYGRYPSRDRSARGRYREMHHADDRDGERRFMSRRGASRSPRRGYSVPRESDTIVVEDFFHELRDQDINYGLKALDPAGLREIRVRSDKSSPPKYTVFMEFRSVEHAVAFLKSFPDQRTVVPLPLDAPIPNCPVRFSFSRSSRGDWKCDRCLVLNRPINSRCRRCGHRERDTADPSESDIPHLTGEQDASLDQKPYPILVVTGLGSNTSEEVLAKGVMKLFLDSSGEKLQQPVTATGLKTTAPLGPSGLGARPGSLRRVFVVRTRKTGASWNYGFAEFATTEDATKAMAKFQATPHFTIASKEVEVAYIHTGVFVPVLPPEPQAEPFVFPALHNPMVKLRYWEYRAYANPYIVSVEPVPEEPATSNTKGKVEKSDASVRKEKKRKAEKELTMGNKKRAAMAPQLQLWARTSAQLRGEAVDGDSLGKNGSGNVDHSGGASPPNKPLDAALTGTGETWQQSKSEPAWSYGHPDKNACLLCRRKFEDACGLRMHNFHSDLHKAKLKSPEATAAATRKLAQLGLAPSVVAENTPPPQPQYRDRARERRETHKQPDRPPVKMELGRRGGDKTTTVIDSTVPPPPPPPPPKFAKGMAMLAKMGLKAGEGLGVDGSGRTEIISTEVYRPGAGLGALGARLGNAEEEGVRATRNNYNDFLKKTQDNARERFKNLQREENQKKE